MFMCIYVQVLFNNSSFSILLLVKRDERSVKLANLKIISSLTKIRNHLNPIPRINDCTGKNANHLILNTPTKNEESNQSWFCFHYEKHENVGS